MSADAKAWQDDGWWHALHDGACRDGQCRHGHCVVGLSLSEALRQVEQCGGYQFAWEIRDYPDGKRGLVGYVYGGGPIDAPQVDYRALLRKYIEHVGACEGVYFLNENHGSFTADEWKALQEFLP